MKPFAVKSVDETIIICADAMLYTAGLKQYLYMKSRFRIYPCSTFHAPSWNGSLNTFLKQKN